jgi:hypothetical protein
MMHNPDTGPGLCKDGADVTVAQAAGGLGGKSTRCHSNSRARRVQRRKLICVTRIHV